MLEANLLLAKVSAVYSHKQQASLRLEKISAGLAKASSLPIPHVFIKNEDLGVFDYLCIKSANRLLASHHRRISVYDKKSREIIVMRIAEASAKSPCGVSFKMIKPGILSWAKDKRSATIKLK